MRILKKDFVNENTESYCAKGHKLSSGTAYYMQAKDGAIYYGGKQCAELHGVNNFKDVPDLTKSLLSLAAGGTSNGGGPKVESEDERKSTATAYLLLREQLLQDFSIEGRALSFETLTQYYNYYLDNGDLAESQVNHIINIESYSSKKIDKRLSLKNLSTCHAYNFILRRTSAHLEEKGESEGVRFVASLKSYLLNHSRLTPGQVDGLKKWIQFLPKDLRNAKLKTFEQ